MVDRNIYKKAKYLLGKYPIVAITGPRQSGKSTFLKMMFPDYAYVSLEDIDTREFAKADTRGFLARYNKKIIIDEAQRVPDLFSYLQTKVDTDNKPGQYILSGSQNFLLSNHISQSLAGRVAMLKLLPFCFDELKAGNWYPKNRYDLIYKGSYPAIYHKKINPTDFYSNYLETYVQKDVRTLLNIGDLRQFTHFLKLCAGRVGQILNVQSLANDAGVSQPTAKAWLSVLETSYIVFNLNPYHTNFNKRLIKSSKLYFYDTGLVSYLLGIKNTKEAETHFAKGALVENMVIVELQKLLYNKGIIPSIYFWRDNHGNEMDLLIDEANYIKLVEIKSTSTFNSSFVKGFSYFKNLKINKGLKNYLVMNIDEPMIRSEIHVIGFNQINSLL